VALGNRGFGSLGLRGVELRQQTLQTLGGTIALGLAQSQAQEASARAEAVRRGEELKSIMIDALAHDLKTPLTAIEAAGDMLGRPLGISEPQKRDLVSVIQEEARGLRRLVDEAIHLARIDARKLKLECEPTPVADVINKAIQSLGERAAPDRVQVQLQDDLPLINVDEELLIQAVKQLLDNALKYSPPNSPVTVSARHDDALVSIAVRDHGPGITELEQSRIFQKFYRGRQDRAGVQGSGMGLAITKEILQAHGGSVMVESKWGEGSLFTLQLQAMPQQVSAPAGVSAE
jgi:two-component system, OmpR family, sensor histidine kinase KdpD